MTGKNFVGFNPSAKGNRFFKTFNPILNKDNPTEFVEASVVEINRAVELADKAYLKLSSIPFVERAKFLDEIAIQIEALGDELLDCYVSESGLTFERAETERCRTLKQIRDFANLVRENNWVEASIDTSDNSRQPVKPDLRKMLFGIGPVVVFGASNFPLAYSTAGGDTISAFAAACPVIVKSHPMHAGTGEMVAGAIVKAAKLTNMPDGIFSNLNAKEYDVGKQLIHHPKVKAIGFTGSVSGGRALFNLANTREEPIPVFAEMGSVNPVVIFPELLQDNMGKWTSMYAESITAGSGQFCTNPGLLFILKSKETDNFIRTLSEKIHSKSSAPMLHPSIQHKFEEGKAKAKSVDYLDFSEKNGKLRENYGRQALMTVTSQVFINNPILHEEVFGPISLIIICEDDFVLKNCLAELKGQLTGSIMASVEEIKKYGDVLFTLQHRVGRVIFNGVPTGVEVCPSMHHGGPYPATTDCRFTAVGIDSIRRFARPVVFQNFPDELLPVTLQNLNQTKCRRRINGRWTEEEINDKKR